MNIYQLKQIETPRLIIRPIHLGDEVEINKAINRSLDDLQRWMPWSKDPSLATTRDFVKKSDSGWKGGVLSEFPMAVIHKKDSVIIAASGFNEKTDLTKLYFEIGYWIDKTYQGQGLVTEFVNALTRYALGALKANRVQINTQVGNIKSISVAERCGFELEAILRNYCIDCVSLKPADALMYACCKIVALPTLDVTWDHDENKKMIEIEQNGAIPVQHGKHIEQLPILETSRLVMAPPKISDMEKVFQAHIASVNEVGPWFTWGRADISKEDIHCHITDAIQASQDIRSADHLFYYAWDKSRNEFLGEIWYKVLDWEQPLLQINYWFDTSFTGKGFAAESVYSVIEYGFNILKARRIQLHTSVTNVRSQRLAERLGFSLEGTLKKHARNFLTGEVLDSKMYSMTDVVQLKSFILR